MADLKGQQIKNRYQSLLTTSVTSANPTTGTIQNGDGSNMTALTVGGTMTATKLVPTGNVTAGNGMYLPATNQIAIGTNGAERVRIDASGDVGIGTTSPQAKLDVVGGGVQTQSSAFSAQGGYYFNAANNASARRWRIANDWNEFGDFVINTSTTQTGDPTTQRLVINAAGNVGIGTTSPQTKLDVVGSAGANVPIRVQGGSSTTDAFIDIKDSTTTADFRVRVGSVGDNFVNYAGGSERMRITSTGVVQPGADNTQTLGSASLRWSEVFAGNGTINTSDATEKQDIEDLNKAEQEVAVALKGLIKKYRWISSVEAKGDDARIHIGVMAQDVQQAFEDAGLDAENYGVFCKDVWHTKEEEYTEKIDNPDFNEEEEESEDNPKQIDSEPKTRTVQCEPCEESTEHIRYGVRYDQLFSFIISAL